MASVSEFLIISQPCEYSSVSTRKDWGMMVPAFIMMVPAFMVSDNRVSLMSKIQQSMKKAHAKEKASSCDEASGSFRANLIRR
jgi:hypothetical protein